MHVPNTSTPIRLPPLNYAMLCGSFSYFVRGIRKSCCPHTSRVPQTVQYPAPTKNFSKRVPPQSSWGSVMGSSPSGPFITMEGRKGVGCGAGGKIFLRDGRKILPAQSGSFLKPPERRGGKGVLLSKDLGVTPPSRRSEGGGGVPRV